MLGFYHLLTLFTAGDNPSCELCCHARWNWSQNPLSRFGHGLFTPNPVLSRSGITRRQGMKSRLTIQERRPCLFFGSTGQSPKSRFGHGLFTLKPDLSRTGITQPCCFKNWLTIQGLRTCLFFESTGQSQKSRFGHDLFPLAPDLSRTGIGQ